MPKAAIARKHNPEIISFEIVPRVLRRGLHRRDRGFAVQFSAGQGASGFGGEFPACSFLDTKRADNVRDGISEITEESDRSPIISTAP